MPTTQAVSHGAGHNLPVNSGKLLVACSYNPELTTEATLQPLKRFVPIAAPHQVVPLRNEVA